MVYIPWHIIIYSTTVLFMENKAFLLQFLPPEMCWIKHNYNTWHPYILVFASLFSAEQPQTTLLNQKIYMFLMLINTIIFFKWNNSFSYQQHMRISVSRKNILAQFLPFFGPPRWLRWLRICLQCRRSRFDLWVGTIPWRRAGHPLQYSCLESPMDRGAWRATVHVVAESQTGLKWLSTHSFSLWPS